MSWEALLDQELLAPGKLDMSDTGFGAPPPLYNSDQPWGHAAEQGNELLIPNKGDNTPGLGPAGTVHTTLQDYAKFVRLLLNGSEGGVSLTTATRNELTKAYPGSTYGYGWGIFEETSGTDTRKILNHAGSNGSWFFVSEIRLDQGYAVIAVTNVANFWEPDLNTFNGLVPDEDGFAAHGAAATGEALTMLHEHFLGCPSWGISGGGWTTADGKIKESTLANQSDLIPVAAVPALSLWGGLALVASLSALGGLALSRVAGGRTPSSS
jgi:hypothetical protein